MHIGQARVTAGTIADTLSRNASPDMHREASRELANVVAGLADILQRHEDRLSPPEQTATDALPDPAGYATLTDYLDAVEPPVSTGEPRYFAAIQRYQRYGATDVDVVILPDIDDAHRVLLDALRPGWETPDPDDTDDPRFIPPADLAKELVAKLEEARRQRDANRQAWSEAYARAVDLESQESGVRQSLQHELKSTSTSVPEMLGQLIVKARTATAPPEMIEADRQLRTDLDTMLTGAGYGAVDAHDTLQMRVARALDGSEALRARVREAERDATTQREKHAALVALVGELEEAGQYLWTELDGQVPAHLIDGPRTVLQLAQVAITELQKQRHKQAAVAGREDEIRGRLVSVIRTLAREQDDLSGLPEMPVEHLTDALTTYAADVATRLAAAERLAGIPIVPDPEPRPDLPDSAALLRRRRVEQACITARAEGAEELAMRIRGVVGNCHHKNTPCHNLLGIPGDDVTWVGELHDWFHAERKARKRAQRRAGKLQRKLTQPPPTA